MSPSDWTTLSALALGCVFLAASRHYFKAKSQRSHPLPPGPPGLPLLGNVLQLDNYAPWVTYTEWGKKYGDLVYFRVLGKDMIVINSEKVAKELLDERSAIYSDRPHLITNELSAMDRSFVFMNYGEEWAVRRRFYHHSFRRAAIHRFYPVQHRKACQLLRRLLDSPKDLSDHVFEYTASIILAAVYDYDTSDQNDELVKIAEKVVQIAVVVTRPDTAFIVEMFPSILTLPSWFPGMSFMKNLAEAKEFTKEYMDKPFEISREKLAVGHTSPSMVNDAYQNLGKSGKSEDEAWRTALKESASAGMLAAAETASSALMTFFLRMLMAPEAQRKAQAQIDAVVGTDRLPSLEDRPSLPYLDAIMLECSRYCPVAPLSGYHAPLEDDIYAGYHIPKGSVVFANAWGLCHDEDKFPNPHKFIPERFLNEDGSLKSVDFDHHIFGYGRRVCLGKYFADATVWIVVAKFLAAFEMLKPLDENGVEVPVEEPKYTSGVAIHPHPFPFRIVPRRKGMDAARLEEIIANSSP